MVSVGLQSPRAQVSLTRDGGGGSPGQEGRHWAPSPKVGEPHIQAFVLWLSSGQAQPHPQEAHPWRGVPALPALPCQHSPSASSPWTPGYCPGGCRRGARLPSVAGCARWSWFSGDSSWRSWPSLLSARATQTYQPVGRAHTCGVSHPQVPNQMPGVKAAAPLFSAQPGAQKSAKILELTQQSILIPPNSPKLALVGPGSQ